jgi:hypothetical protein
MEEAQEDSARRFTLQRSAAGGPSASETLSQLLRDEIAPTLRELGMKGSGGKFRLDRGDYRATLELQKSSGNRKSICEFTFNLAAWNRRISSGGGYWDARIGEVLPDMGDTWWVLPANASTEDLKNDLHRAVCVHAFLALEAALDDPQYPPAPGKHWPRTFIEPSSGPNDVYGHELASAMSGRQPSFWRPNPGYEALLLEASSLDFEHGDNDSRSQLFGMLLAAAPGGDARCVPALSAFLANEPSARLRAQAGLALALAEVDPKVVLPDLHAAASQDCDPSVRVYARYAIRLIGHPLDRPL